MTVSVTAHRSHTVIDMTSPQPLPTHKLLKLTEKSVEAGLGAEVVASRHGVAGVQTDPDPGLVLHQVNNRLQLSQIPANGVALCGDSVKHDKRPEMFSDLTTHVLQHHSHIAPLSLQVGRVDPVSDVSDALSTADFTHRRA